MKMLVRLLVLLAILMAVTFQPVHADAAPPEPPPGSNLLPGDETTQVAMLAETVTLNVLPDPADEQGAIAKTVAFFTMRNLGATTENMQVRFPLSFLFWGNEVFPEIADLKVKVNGHSVPTARIVSAYQQTDLPWAVFGVDFPPAEDVSIEVSYTAQGYGYYPYESFRYILETGAGWKGTIGSGDIIVRFPYEANSKNVWVGQTTGYSDTSPALNFSGNEVRWHFENLEPTTGDNIEIWLVTPSLWKKVLKELVNVTQNPDDGEAWGRLAKAYKEVIRMPKGYLREDPDGRDMYVMSRDAYERCLALLPKDSLWHTGYADLLWSHYYFDIFQMSAPDTENTLLGTLSELQIALELDPNNQLAKDLLSEISNAFPEVVKQTSSGYDFLALTATPIPPTLINFGTQTATSIPTVPAITSTATQLIETQPISPVEGRPSVPFCASTAFVLPALAGALWVSCRKRS
jgi:hypothetical protein